MYHTEQDWDAMDIVSRYNSHDVRYLHQKLGYEHNMSEATAWKIVMLISMWKLDLVDWLDEEE